MLKVSSLKSFLDRYIMSTLLYSIHNTFLDLHVRYSITSLRPVMLMNNICFIMVSPMNNEVSVMSIFIAMTLKRGPMYTI